ncbi:MAG: hypothetical protein ACJ768_11780 [Gaiellaceae bacterium]
MTESAYLGQLVRQLRAAEDELAELRPLRRRLADAEAALAALHDGEEPHEDERTVPSPAQWLWHWNRATPAERLERAAQVLADWEHVHECFLLGWKKRARNAEARVRELQPRLDSAEAKLAEPVTLTARYLSHLRQACPGCEWAVHAPLSCDEVAAFRDRFDNLLADGLKEIRADDNNLTGYRGVVNAPLTFETITALADRLRQGTMPRRKVHRSAPATGGGLTVVTTDPVQEIAAEPATLDALKHKFFAEPANRPTDLPGQIGHFFGFPMTADPDLPPGEVHMRPYPQTTEA